MLVTFHTKAYADITMFGDVAISILKMMGLSGAVPSALMPEDIPAALNRLERALRQQADKPALPREDDSEEEEEPPVSLSQRALPLVELLRAAQRAGTEVMWDS